MSAKIVLWICVSPTLQRFDRPLLNQLATQGSVLQWEYMQSLDEGSCLDQAVEQLQEFVRSFLQTGRQPRTFHLGGHGTGGLVALLYARRYPQWVESLALLGVAPTPSLTWHSHYYLRRQLTSWSRPVLLSQMVTTLFGEQPPAHHRCLRQRLEQDLDTALTPHSLLSRAWIPAQGVEMPLFVGGAMDDEIIDRASLEQWQPFLKPGDRLWVCAQGRHFFHALYPTLVAQHLRAFWHHCPWGLSPGERFGA
jgi:pimeloyl-ACP methyl ester carboxylesterase